MTLELRIRIRTSEEQDTYSHFSPPQNMDSILSYILTAVKKAKYIVFSQAGQIYGRQNKVGCIAAFDCALPAEYDQ